MRYKIMMSIVVDAAGERQAREYALKIKALLKETGVDEQMKLFGIWDDFAAGRRGRPEPFFGKEKAEKK